MLAGTAYAAAPIELWYYTDSTKPDTLDKTKQLAVTAFCTTGRLSCSITWVEQRSGTAPWRQEGTASFYTQSCSVISGGSTQCVNNPTQTQSGIYVRYLKMGCAANPAIAPDTTKPTDQQCADPDPCIAKKGQKSGIGHYDVGLNPKVFASACQGGCLATWQGDDVGFTRLQSGVRHYYAYGEYINEGSKCTASDTQPEVPISAAPKDSKGKPTRPDGVNPPVCNSGEQSGIVNNKPVCLGRDNTSGVTFVTSGSNPVNAVGQQSGVVTKGSNIEPADGSYENYCNTHGTVTICSGAGLDPSDGTTGTGSSTGSGAGETSSGSGTGSSGSGTGTGTVNCPGCATEATLLSIKGFLNPAGVDPGGVVNGAGKAEDGFKPMQDSLTAMQGGNGPLKDLSWSFGGLFPASAQCSPFTLNVNGRAINQTATLDVCDWINLARSILGWLCYVLTALGIYRIATGQKSQGEAA